MNTMTNKFKKMISNSSEYGSATDFVNHQELSLVYSDIKDDIQGLDRKFSAEFVRAFRAGQF